MVRTTEWFGKFIGKLQIYDYLYLDISVIVYFWNIRCHLLVDFQKVYQMIQYFSLLTEIQFLGKFLENLPKYQTKESIIKYRIVSN